MNSSLTGGEATAPLPLSAGVEQPRQLEEAFQEEAFKVEAFQEEAFKVERSSSLVVAGFCLPSDVKYGITGPQPESELLSWKSPIAERRRDFIPPVGLAGLVSLVSLDGLASLAGLVSLVVTG